MKKRLPVILSILIIIGCMGFIAYDYATDFIVKKTIIFIREDAALQADVQKIIDNHTAQEAINQTDGISEPSGESENPADGTANTSEKGNTAKEPLVTYSKGEDGVLSIEDLQSDDKAYVMSIYYRFTAGEVNTVSQMMADGITAEEKSAIKQIIYAKVSSAEVDKLFAIARKYQ